METRHIQYREYSPRKSDERLIKTCSNQHVLILAMIPIAAPMHDFFSFSGFVFSFSYKMIQKIKKWQIVQIIHDLYLGLKFRTENRKLTIAAAFRKNRLNYTRFKPSPEIPSFSQKSFKLYTIWFNI